MKSSSNTSSPASRLRVITPEHQQLIIQQRYSSSASDDDSGCVMDEYSWTPSGIKPDMDKVPYVNSAGEQWRLQQLKKQLPPQDSDPRFCAQLTAAEARELSVFDKSRKKRCLGKGQIRQLPHDPTQKIYCHQCKLGINVEEELVVSAPERFEERAFWHPKCFVCVECQELLVDLIYFRHNENVFCGRHHAEQLKPRCASCDELILSEECTEAEGGVWHMSHFICQLCSIPLGGQRYIQRDRKPYCVPCYRQHHASAQRFCHTCQGQIPMEQPHITQGELHWHADANCFCCAVCQRNLLGKRYTFNASLLICGPFDGCAKKQQLSSPRVRFNFENENNKQLNPKHPPPARSPPPIPKTSPITKHLTPPENIYETVLAISPSTSHASPNTSNAKFRQTNRESFSDSTEEDEEPERFQRRGRFSIRKNDSRTPNFEREFIKRQSLPRSRSADGKHRKQQTTTNLPDISKIFDQNNVKFSKVSLRSQQNFYSRMPPNDSFTPYANGIRYFNKNGRTYSSYSTSSSSESDTDDAFFEHYLASVSLPRRYSNNTQIKINNSSTREKTAKKRLAKLAVKNRDKPNSSNCIVS